MSRRVAELVPGEVLEVDGHRGVVVHALRGRPFLVCYVGNLLSARALKDGEHGLEAEWSTLNAVDDAVEELARMALDAALNRVAPARRRR